MDKRTPYKRVMPDDYKGGGVVRFLAAAEGYVMVRRPCCTPFVVHVSEWNEWPLYTEPGRRG